MSVTVSGRDRTRVFAIRPWVAGSALSLAVVAATTIVGSAAYLIYRDDLVSAAIERQVEMQYAYEERIAALRGELDRITSRHSVQTEGVEQQLASLLDRQALIDDRQSALDALVEKARASGVQVAATATRLPRPRPAVEAEGSKPGSAGIAPLGHMPSEPAADHDAVIDTLLHGEATGGPHIGLKPILAQVKSSLADTQARQTQALDALSATVEGEAERLSTVLTPIGIEVEEPEVGAAQPQGGPFIPAAGLHFVERTAVLHRMLDDIQQLRRSAAAMPLKAPLTARRVSSRFGYRIDPFLNRRAFHNGLDLVAPLGAEVRATAPGVVVSAAWNAGYGNMVEVRHAGGITTRYGHLSAILVSRGTRVAAGTPIGRVGSTGRSTGPHLHYETRREGEPVNPVIFFAAGHALSGS
jgi:murein DD-endopeptidase MepM/ murein hydrolase activator NlpD